MPRFSLRTLIVVMMVAGPFLALAWLVGTAISFAIPVTITLMLGFWLAVFVLNQPLKN